MVWWEELGLMQQLKLAVSVSVSVSVGVGVGDMRE
jgi:hypothetical protein